MCQCAEYGIYLFRINLFHEPLDQGGDTIKKIREWADVPICLDSKGKDGSALIAETTIGRYPVEAVTMIRITAGQVNKWSSHASLDELVNS